jgi:hypothetical protein
MSMGNHYQKDRIGFFGTDLSPTIMAKARGTSCLDRPVASTLV